MNLSNFFPEVVNFIPDINSQLDTINANPVFRLTFNTELNYAQISNNISLNQCIVLIQEDNKASFPLSFVAYNKKVLDITPTSGLVPGKTYQLIVLESITSDQGRPSGKAINLPVQVTSSSLATPILVLPADKTSTETVPIFSWSPVTSPGTGTVLYNIQLDTKLEFNTVLQNGWSTQTPLVSALPGILLTPNTTYYWRVNAQYTSGAVTTTSNWSDVWSVYFGTDQQPTPDTRQTFPDILFFSVIGSSLDNGSSNNKDWPHLAFTFNTPIATSTINASSLLFRKESVDGYPNSQKTNVNYTWAVSGNTITLTPTDVILQDQRYTITFTSLLTDQYNNSIQPFETYFTSTYFPYYVSSIVIRAKLGSLVDDFTDDLINFHIFRASLEASRDLIFYYSVWLGGPMEDMIRGFLFPLTFPMEKWVECKAAKSLLDVKYYELLEKADNSKKLGDYSEARGYNILREIENKRNLLEEEAKKWNAEFTRHKARPISATKSSRWPPYRSHYDVSFRGNIRTGKI